MSASRPLLSTAERWRRACRDREAARVRSLARRSALPVFSRYREVVPAVFLRQGASAVARLLRPAAAVRDALRGRSVWTLDTAARLRFAAPLLASGDLTGYLSAADLDDAVRAGLIAAASSAAPSVDPPYPRPASLVVAIVDELPASERLASGDLVVLPERLVRDLVGTLGLRLDLLARLEGAGLGEALEREALEREAVARKAGGS